MADDMGVGDTHHPTNVGVFFGDRPGERVPDPFFGGLGPARTGCTHCGSCMTGCRHGAKNTLVKNYLYLAERAGAEVHALTTATDVRPLPGGGYAVHTRAMSLWPNKGEADVRPPVGASYERLSPVQPKSPVVPEAAPAALRLPIFPKEGAR